MVYHWVNHGLPHDFKMSNDQFLRPFGTQISTIFLDSTNHCRTKEGQAPPTVVVSWSTADNVPILDPGRFKTFWVDPRSGEKGMFSDRKKQRIKKSLDCFWGWKSLVLWWFKGEESTFSSLGFCLWWALHRVFAPGDRLWCCFNLFHTWQLCRLRWHVLRMQIQWLVWSALEWTRFLATTPWSRALLAGPQVYCEVSGGLVNDGRCFQCEVW